MPNGGQHGQNEPDPMEGHKTIDVSAIVGGEVEENPDDQPVASDDRDIVDILNDPDTPRSERIKLLNRMAEEDEDDTDPPPIEVEPEGPPQIVYTTLMRTQRGRFVAAVWLLGASWAQIGGLFQVRRETVMQQANRYIPPDIRAEYAYSREHISHERISELYRAWEELCINSQGLVQTASALVLANVLNKRAVRDTDGGSGDAYLNVGRG